MSKITLLAGQTWGATRAAINTNFSELYNSIVVDNLSALKALSTTTGAVTVLGYYDVGDGGGGVFIWNANDLSIEVSNDTQSGVYAAPDNASTGISGAWVRSGVCSHIDARWFGLCEVDTDNGVIINACISYLDTGNKTITGGRIYIPRGTYSCSTPIVITSTETDKLSSIELYGDGMQNTSLVAAVALPNDNALVEVLTGTFCSIHSLHLNANNSAKNALWLKGQLSGASGYSHLSMKRLRLQNALYSGFLAERGFLIIGEDVFSTNNARHGFEFLGYHTSCNIKQFYAASNTSNGFSISDMSYSTFINCASDSSGQYGYVVTNTRGINFINCGAESSQRSNFLFFASDAYDAVPNRVISGIDQTTLDGCFAYNGDLAGGGYGSGYRTEQSGSSKLILTVKNFTDYTSPNSVSVTASGISPLHRVLDSNSYYAGSYATSAIEANPNSTIRVNAKTISGATNIVNLKNIFGKTEQYSGMVHIMATAALYNAGTTNASAYVLLITKSSAGSSVVLVASNGLISGSGASHPSFTFSIDTTNNTLIATPIGSTNGVFYFYITQCGGLMLTQ